MASKKNLPTVSEVKADLVKTIIAANIAGMTTDLTTAANENGPLFVDWSRANGVVARITVSLEVNADLTHGFTVSVEWNLTARTSARARAAVALYSQVADLACLIEAMLEGVRARGWK